MAAKRGDWLGTIRLATPLSHRILTVFALGVGVALVAFAICGHYTRRQRTPGMLVPVAGLIEIKAPAAGTVTQLRVAQGAQTHAGDTLVALSAERVSLAMGDTATAVAAQLKLQRARIDADLADQMKLEQQQNAGLTSRIGMLRAQRVQLDGQIAIQRQQAKSITAILEKIQPLLKKGYVSVLQVQQEQSAALDAQAQVKALSRQRLDIQQQLSTQRDQLQQLPLTTAEQRHDLESKRAQIDQSMAQNEAQRSSVQRAPEDGVVSAVFVKPGQSVSAGQTLLAIVPKDSPLEAQLLVPSSAIGFVAPGQTVVLRYQAYPYQKFGLQRGRVSNVSHSALTPADAASVLGEQTRTPVYRVDVALDRQSVQAYGKAAALKPGMALDADILLDKRRLIEWVFEPLYGMGRQMFAGKT